MADVPGKFYRATKVRTGVSPSSPGAIEGEPLPPVNPPGSSLNSVGLTMPSAFTVSNSPLTANGTIGVAGAGTVSQYIRGDGSLADFPESSGGGGSVSYYLNGSVNQGTIGGVAYKELNKVPILGSGTDFTINADGYIASFITDAGDPNLLEIPGGNWNFETYFSASSSGGTPTFYVELYKYDGTTFTLIASSVTSPEFIAFGTTLTPYFSTLAVPTTTLALTDRLAVRYYVTHSGRTITLHTENNHLCQIITTFTTGLTALNGLTAQVQNFAVGTTGTDFNIASAVSTHTFNMPTASATNRGALSSADWSLFTQAYNDKINSAAVTGTTTKTLTLTQQDGGTITASWSDLNTDAVLSVFGRTGAVVAANGDYTTAQVTESGNLYYTDARSRAALSFAAGSGAYNTSTGVITIPTNNNQITNGAGYITSAALAGYLPLSGGVMTGPITTPNSTFGIVIGDDSRLADRDIANTLFVEGVQNTDRGYINFSQTTGNALGAINGGNLTWRGNSVVTGTGTTNYLPKFTGTSTIGNSQVFDNGTNVGIGSDSISNGTTFGGGGQINRLKVQSSNYTCLEINGSTSGSSIQFTYGTNLPNQVSGLIGYNYSNGTVNEFYVTNILSGPLVFATTNAEAMRIFAGQNVHIGPTPASDNGARLQVSGDVRTTGSLRVEGNTDPNSASAAFFWNQAFLGPTISGYNFEVRTGNTGSQARRLFINESGAATFSNTVNSTRFLNPGGPYGTGAANARNHFTQFNAGNAALAGGWIAGAFGDALGNRIVIGQYQGIAAIAGHNGNLDDWASMSLATGGGNVLIGTISDNGSGSRLQVSGNTTLSGSLGVGRAPAAPFDVFGSSSGALSFMQNTASNGYSGIDIFRQNGTHAGSVWCANDTASASNNRNALTIAARTANEKVIIVGGGFDPTVTGGLEVLGSQTRIRGNNSHLIINAASGDYCYLYLQNTAGPSQRDSYFIQNASNSTANSVASGSAYMYFTHGQQMEFNWAGVSRIQFNSSGNITATAFFESSDARLKSDIINLDVDASVILAKHYTKDGVDEIGYLAQDVEKILPSAISKKHDGYLNLSYRQVHTAKIAYLEKRITELEQQLKNR